MPNARLFLSTDAMEQHNLVRTGSDSALTCVPLPVRNRSPHPAIGRVRYSWKPYLGEACLLHDGNIPWKLPCGIGEGHHLHNPCIPVAQFRYRFECGFCLTEIRFELIRFTIPKRVEGRTVSVKSIGDPKRRRRFTTALYLPAMLKDVNSWIWRRRKNKAYWIADVQSRLFLNANSGTMKANRYPFYTLRALSFD